MQQTKREQDAIVIGVLSGLASGLTDVEVARQVHVSPRTVQRVIDQFKEDTGASTRFAAGVVAVRMGLV